MLRSATLIVAAICFLASAQVLAGVSPQQFVRNFATEIRLALDRGDVQGANLLLAKHFDMVRFGKLCLIDHWDKFSNEERTTYIELLGKSIRRQISDKMLFTADDMDFVLTPLKTNIRGDGFTNVENTLRIKSGDFKLVLSLSDDKNSRRIVDYELEGALLSRNYRGQFNYLIRKYGKEGFLERLKKKSDFRPDPVASR